ncbi:MAG: response regulator transcription factor [Chloroflexi bacterium]|nr:response regulator transcription factor [Chloroflexota bacterium]
MTVNIPVFDRSTRPTVLIIDDDPGLRDLVRMTCERERFTVVTADGAGEGIELARKHTPDIVLLDVIMPDGDGRDVCRTIRQFSQAPILMLTALNERVDVVEGFESGADDYLRKPFYLEELTARMRALLRRMPAATEPLVAAGRQISIDRRRRYVVVRGAEIELTPTEYSLLLMLAERAGEAVDHETLRAGVWGGGGQRDRAGSLKVYIWHLRQKLERDPQQPTCLLTERGIGYRLAP